MATTKMIRRVQRKDAKDESNVHSKSRFVLIQRIALMLKRMKKSVTVVMVA